MSARYAAVEPCRDYATTTNDARTGEGSGPGRRTARKQSRTDWSNASGDLGGKRRKGLQEFTVETGVDTGARGANSLGGGLRVAEAPQGERAVDHAPVRILSLEWQPASMWARYPFHGPARQHRAGGRNE